MRFQESDLVRTFVNTEPFSWQERNVGRFSLTSSSTALLGVHGVRPVRAPTSVTYDPFSQL